MMDMSTAESKDIRCKVKLEILTKENEKLRELLVEACGVIDLTFDDIEDFEAAKNFLDKPEIKQLLKGGE
jgi:hypothetical protein